MVGLTFTSTKTADGKQNFKTCFYFLNLEFSSLIGILLTLSALHAIPHDIFSKGYLITFCNCSKGNQTPFCKVREGIRLPHAIPFYFRGFFQFCLRYLIPFCTLQKGIQYLLDLKQKGAINPYK